MCRSRRPRAQRRRLCQPRASGDAESATLLNAYVERMHGQQWQQQQRSTPPQSGAMTRDEALQARELGTDPKSGKPISGSKYLEVHFRDGKIVEMSNEFGLGRK